MGRHHFAAMLLISFLIIGCFGEPIADWGDDKGDFKTEWDKNPESLVKVTSNIYKDEVNMNLTLQGCNDVEAKLKPGSTGEVTREVKVAGWLISSKFWTSADEIKDEAQQAIPASVLIALDDYDTAKEKSFDQYDKMSVEWSLPTNVDTMPKFDASANKHSNYAVIGIIPSNERVLNGFEALTSFHQPVELTGYAVNTMNPSVGAYPDSWKLEESCRAVDLAETGINMVVTGITLENNEILMDGNEKSKWSKGDIPLLPGGAYTYILLVLFGGGGGAVLLFTFSVGVERHGAKSTAKAMLTDAQMKMAKVVRKDIKKAKKEGVDLSAGSMISNDEEIKEKKKTTQKLDDFDVESVLSSISEGRAQGAELGGGGVILTDDAYDMGDQLQESIDSGGVNLGDSTERIGHTLAFDIDDILNPENEEEEDYEGYSTSNQRSSRTPPNDRKRVTGRQSVSSEGYSEKEGKSPPKRRAVRKVRSSQDSENTSRSPPTRTPPKKSKPSINEDDDFSDFSL